MLLLNFVLILNEGLNSNTTDLSAGGIFVYSYDEAARTVEFKIKEGLNYKVKIPTDVELANYVNNSWNTTQANYDSSNPVSRNYLLSNFVPTSPLTTWTSSYLNLVPFRYLFITSQCLNGLQIFGAQFLFISHNKEGAL